MHDETEHTNKKKGPSFVQLLSNHRYIGKRGTELGKSDRGELQINEMQTPPQLYMYQVIDL